MSHGLTRVARQFTVCIHADSEYSAHKRLRRLYEQDNAKGVPTATTDTLRNMLAVLDDLESVQELQAFKFWKAHPLAGDRKGSWSLFVTRNWRLTFVLDEQQQTISDVNLEDYH